MNIKELIKKLDNLGVSRNEYSINKEEKEKYCLVKTKLSYVFFYLEKPQKKIVKQGFFKTYYEEYNYKSLRKYFETEEEAFDFMYAFFTNNKYENSSWIFQKSIVSGEKFELEEGINIWDFDWIETERLVNIKDNKYEQRYLTEIRQIDIGGRIIEFLAEEVANGCWIIFQKDNIPRLPHDCILW